jgi:thiamine-phosphate pyrophosphorylase
MKLTVITHETFFAGEANALNRLFEQGMEALHLRKPVASAAEIRVLLSEIDEKYHSRIVLHDHFSLLESFRLKGVHLNRRNAERPEHRHLSISRSCHSLDELKNIDKYNYVFISPIFDSISKKGYQSAFTREQLLQAKKEELIHEKIIALGGISAENISLAATFGFGGVAVVGALWGDFPSDNNLEALLKRFDNLQALCCPSLLFITHQTDRYTYLQSVEIALAGGCRQIQLRMKDAAQDELEQTALIAKSLCDKYNANLYINDNATVCKNVQARGVHLGKTDMSPQEARQLLGANFVIGGTANTFDDIQHLKNEGVDYIGLGPFRFTATKRNLSPVIGLDGYRQIMKRCKTNSIYLPIVAIGGITSGDIPALMQVGVHGIALSSTILYAENPVEEATKLIKILERVNK